MRPQDKRLAAVFARADADGGSAEALKAAWRLHKRGNRLIEHYEPQR